jgi:hypothetical protein
VGENNMPGIYNINNGYNANTKKVSSKLTFEVGERFTGRVVSKGDGKDVTIKLADGWQFIAELQESVQLDDTKLVKFQVDGFQNGKLNLKMVKGSEDDEILGDENFQEVIEKEGLSKGDIDVLRGMIKHNISLTRENISKIKGLIQFNEKIASNPKEIDSFVQTYLQSKNITDNSEQGQATKELLTKFLGEFKNITSEDILTFIENNLDFSEENINSFNKLFKRDSSIEQILEKINESLKSIDSVTENNIETEMNNKSINIEAELTKNITDNNTIVASKVYNKNDPLTNKINILDILKTLAGSENSELDVVQRNAGKESNISNFEKLNLSVSLIKKLEEPEVAKLIKDTIGNSITTNDTPKTQAQNLIESSNKFKLEGILSNMEGKEVKLTDEEFKAFGQLINNKDQVKEILKEIELDNKSNIETKTVLTNAEKEAVIIKENLGESNLDNKESIKTEMKDKINNIRDIVKYLINQTDVNESVHEKIMNLVKSNMNDIKVYNSISDEYYYLNIPITAEGNKYPCKLIVKDNRKDGKKIDTTNTKMVVSVKTINLGEVDGYLTMRENKIDVKLKCESNFTSVLNNNKFKLVDGLATLGLFVNISVSTKEKPIDLVNCRNFFNDLTMSTIDIKV